MLKIIFTSFASGILQSGDKQTFIEKIGRRFQKSSQSFFSHHYNRFVDLPQYQRTSYYPTHREGDSTDTLMPYILNQLYKAHKQHQQKQRHKEMDNMIGSILKKILLNEEKLSRTSLTSRISDFPMEILNLRVFDNNTNEEQDWKTALALSVNSTVDSLPLEDKMAAISEYFFGTVSEDEPIREAWSSPSFSMDDEILELLRSNYHEGEAPFESLPSLPFRKNDEISEFFHPIDPAGDTTLNIFIISSMLYFFTNNLPHTKCDKHRRAMENTNSIISLLLKRFFFFRNGTTDFISVSFIGRHSKIDSKD